MLPVIETERLVLRPVRLDDVEALFGLFNNWNVIRWLSSPPWPHDIGMTRAYVAKCVELGGAFEDYRVIVRGDGIIGVISWRKRGGNDAPRSGGASIGYWLGEPYWGKGYMSEAVKALVTAVFSAMPIPAIYSGVFDGNEASLRILEKLGFVVTGQRTMFSNPAQTELPFLDVVLTREHFEKNKT
jgi:RimJ/RimL family protein N-acetyltransferase